MPSIFTRIIQGDIPSYKIAETESSYAFLDINPLKAGHVLVVPKHETDRLFDLDDDSYSDLFSFCKSLAQAIKEAFPCDRVGMAVIGLEVPHAHVHLIPIDRMVDMDFAQPKASFSKEEFEEIASRIRKAFGDLN
jgi:histidine triad (HIT) family protein